MKIGLVIFGIILAGLGYFAFRYPEDFIYLSEHWRFDSFEPSDHYVKHTKRVGIFFIAIAVVCCILAYFL